MRCNNESIDGLLWASTFQALGEHPVDSEN